LNYILNSLESKENNIKRLCNLFWLKKLIYYTLNFTKDPLLQALIFIASTLNDIPFGVKSGVNKVYDINIKIELY
jgi:hypothetical protein